LGYKLIIEHHKH